MTAEHDCSKTWVWAATGSHRCFRPATIERDGQWWCGQHDPERVEANKKKRRAGWQAKMDRRAAKYARIARNARLAALVNEKMPALLERLANDAEYVSMTDEPYRYMTVQDTEAARETAARIKEALALEVNDET